MKTLLGLPDIVRATLTAALRYLVGLGSKGDFDARLLDFDKLVQDGQAFSEFGGEIVSRPAFELGLASIRHEVEWPIRPDPTVFLDDIDRRLPLLDAASAELPGGAIVCNGHVCKL